MHFGSGLPPALGISKACFQKKSFNLLNKSELFSSLETGACHRQGWPCTFEGLGFPVFFFYRLYSHNKVSGLGFMAWEHTTVGNPQAQHNIKHITKT
jgi:hypothetical protein